MTCKRLWRPSWAYWRLSMTPCTSSPLQDMRWDGRKTTCMNAESLIGPNAFNENTSLHFLYRLCIVKCLLCYIQTAGLNAQLKSLGEINFIFLCKRSPYTLIAASVCLGSLLRPYHAKLNRFAWRKCGYRRLDIAHVKSTIFFALPGQPEWVGQAADAGLVQRVDGTQERPR